MCPCSRLNLTKLLSPLALCLAIGPPGNCARADESVRRGEVVGADSLRGKIMCGYQGWFRCPGDASGLGWIHYSRRSDRITPDSLVFEMWPDVSEFGNDERFTVPGFTYPDDSQAELFSSDHPATVERHFEWMQDYGIDGTWLQHFLVDLPGQQNANRYPSRRRVLNYVAESARRTGRAWALSFDVAAMPTDRIFDALTKEWRQLVDDGVTADPRYLREKGRPVVQVWGFYHHNQQNHITPELGNRLIEFFHTTGPYTAYLLGGGDWDWRRNTDPDWRKMILRLDAYAPWNVGNFSVDATGDKHASMSYWADDQRECEEHGVLWLPVIYPGFSWDNLMQQPPGSTTIARRGGKFLWEQFHELSKLGVDCAYIAMFDEIDEGTAIFKVTSTPPTQAHFVGYDGLPSDWYLRLVGEGGRLLRTKQPVPSEIPLKPWNSNKSSTQPDFGKFP